VSGATRKTRTKAITAEAQRRRGNAEKGINRKGAKAQRKAAKNFRISDFVFVFLCVPMRLCASAVAADFCFVSLGALAVRFSCLLDRLFLNSWPSI
jgi:hypothetical protein